MPYAPDIHHRKSIRLHGYDYHSPGAYFITVCTRNRAPVFGHIAAGMVHLNEIGRMVQAAWHGLDKRYTNLYTDEFVIMPDHIHGIIHVGAAPCGRPDRNGGHSIGQPQVLSGQRQEVAPTSFVPDCRLGQPQGVAPTRGLSLPDAVHRFKSLTAARYRNMAMSGALWQRNYWERIIRDDAELRAVRRYIRDNPLRAHVRARNT